MQLSILVTMFPEGAVACSGAGSMARVWHQFHLKCSSRTRMNTRESSSLLIRRSVVSTSSEACASQCPRAASRAAHTNSDREPIVPSLFDEFLHPLRGVLRDQLCLDREVEYRRERRQDPVGLVTGGLERSVRPFIEMDSFGSDVLNGERDRRSRNSAT